MKMQVIVSVAALVLGTAAYPQMQGMQSGGKEMKSPRNSEVNKAIAVLSPAGSGQVHGVVTFEMTDQGMKIVADVTGLTPGKHGFHIHEFGDCSSADFTSAGGHFMIPGETHGALTDPARHLGDMGNIEADATGHAHMECVDTDVAFSGPKSILGRSVVVHEKEDDLKTQPTGNSGARIACGTIGIAKP